MNKFLTIIIPSYRSKYLVLSHIKNLYKKYKIIIVENSYDQSLKEIIKKKYKNVDIFLKKNIGYGSAVNFASKKVKTKFFFVMNPDVKLKSNTLKNLINVAKNIPHFGAIGPINLNQKKKYKNIIVERKKLIAAAMLLQTGTFKKINGYDENFFLYYEDDDFFTRCNSLKLKLYLITNSLFDHVKYQKKINTLNLHSTTFSNYDEKKSTFVVGGWHGQWSKFYFIKKHNGLFIALLKCFPNFLINLFQIFPYFLLNPTKAKYKYFKIEGFICSLIGTSSFKRSKFDKKYIY